MKNIFTSYITKDPMKMIYNAGDLLSYTSYLSSEVFDDSECMEILKDFFNCRKEFKSIVESYVVGKEIDFDRLIDLGSQLNIDFYYDEPQGLVPFDKKYSDKEQLKWILDYYKDYLNDVKNEDAFPPKYTGEIGTVGYYGGYIKDVDKLDATLKKLYIDSLTDLERSTLGL